MPAPMSDCDRLENFARTKTVATIGPASRSPEILEELIRSGVSVARLNMAHGTIDFHTENVSRIRAASKAVGLPVAILADLAGPKIRLGQLQVDPMQIETGQAMAFVRGDTPGSPDELTCTYETLVDEVKTGDLIVLADGAIHLEVVESQAERLECRALDGGTIRSRQGVNLPATDLSVPALGPIDKTNAVWACQQEIDFISISFVRNADEVKELKELIAAQNSSAHVVAKIEKAEAIRNLDEIVQATDVVMVARGDLGVEIAIEKTPLAQKNIIRKCLQHSRPVIVATQMLESMHTNKQPTRAEVSDVANAILDGADACMLSGETAIGEFPVQSVRMMQKIKRETESMLQGRASKISSQRQHDQWVVSDAVVFGSAQVARRIGAKVVFFASASSHLPLVKSKQRDFVPSVCLTNEVHVYRRLCLYWGVIPVWATNLTDQNLPMFIRECAHNYCGLSEGDHYVTVLDTEILPGVLDTILVCKA